MKIAPVLRDPVLAPHASHMGTQLAAAAAGVGVLLVDAHTAKVCGLVEVPLAAALRRTLPALHGGALWLVVHRALRDIPRIAAVWTFLEEAARAAGLKPDPPEADPAPPAPPRSTRACRSPSTA